MRIVLHAGLHKTGSTAIQRAFCARPPAGIATPGGPRLNLSDDVRLLFQQGAALERVRAARYAGLDAAALARWQGDLAARWQGALGRCREPVFLISAEDLSAPDFDAAALVRLVAFLRAARPEARIEALAYIRSPVSFMQSAFQQRIRQDKPGAAEIDPASLWPGYRARMEKFDTVLGPEAVTLRAFAPGDFPGGDVVADMAGWLGLEVAGGTRANDGLSREAMAVLHARLAGTLPDDYPDAACAAQFRALPACALSGFGTGRFGFAAALTDPVRAAQAADLAWMEARLGRALSDPAPPPDAIAGAADLQAIALECRAALAAHIAALPAPRPRARLRGLAGRALRALLRRDPPRQE